MNYQRKLDLLIERALAKNIMLNKTILITEQNPPSNGGFVYTPSEEEVVTNNNNDTKKPTKKVKKVTKPKNIEPEPKKDNTPEKKLENVPVWTGDKDLTARDKAVQQKIQKYYDKDNPEHEDAWNGLWVYATLAGIGIATAMSAYWKYKAVTDTEWATLRGIGSRYGQPFWPGWIRWFGGQRRQDLEDLRKFLNLERERGRITQTTFDEFIRALRRSDDYIMRAKTFNEEIKAVRSGRQTMRQLIKKLPSAYRNNKQFVAALIKYDDEVLAYSRPGGPRVRRNPAGTLVTTSSKYASWYMNLSDDVKLVDWPLFMKTFGNRFGIQFPKIVDETKAWPFGNIEGTYWEGNLKRTLRKATESGDPIPLSDYGIQNGGANGASLPTGQGRFLGSDGKLAGLPMITKPTITITQWEWAFATVLRNVENTVKNNVPCVEFHLKYQTGAKENLKKFLMSDEMTTIAGESYSSVEANAIIRKLENDGSNIVLPKKYTAADASIPDMNQWSTDMKEIGLQSIYRNDANRKRQIAYAEIYKILVKGL
jgi:hypothetical protein